MDKEDMGLLLSLKDDSKDEDIDKMIDEINIVIEKYGYRVKTYNTFQNFLRLCVAMDKFMSEKGYY